MSTVGGTESGSPMSLNIDASGVLRLRWRPGVEITEELAREAMRAVDELNDGVQRPLHVDMTGTASISREARRRFTEFESASRIALVGRSAVDRVLVNFALGVTAIPVPTRFFTSETAATEWLHGGRAAA